MKKIRKSQFIPVDVVDFLVTEISQLVETSISDPTIGNSSTIKFVPSIIKIFD